MNAPGSDAETAPRGRLWLGGFVLVVGFLSPLLIPVVTASSLPVGWKTALSGLLALGVPELFMLIAVAIMGKSGYDYLKQRAGALLKRHGPPERVSRSRYRLGLVLFTASLLLGWASPYVGHLLPGYESHPLRYAVTGDVILLFSLIVLGGEFWDKLRALFVHGARAVFPIKRGS